MKEATSIISDSFMPNLVISDTPNLIPPGCRGSARGGEDPRPLPRTAGQPGLRARPVSLRPRRGA